VADRAENRTSQVTQRFERLYAQPFGYALLLAIGIGAFLLSMGLNAHSLPFPRTGDFSDVVTSHWPNALYLQRSIHAGEFPLWRSLFMSGQPFAANPLNKVWYPPQWLAILLPATVHLNVLLWLHLTLAGVGMRVFAIRLGLPQAIAGVMGIAFAFTPHLIAIAGAGHLDIVYATAWLPWLLWALTVSIHSSNSLIIGAIMALCFLADVRTSVFVFGMAGAYTLWQWQRDRQNKQQNATRSLLAALSGAAMGVALTTVQWLPLLTLFRSLSRAGLTAADAATESLQATQAITLLITDRGGNYESMLYVGVGVLALALLGFLSNWRGRWLWAATVLFALWYALGSNGALWVLLIRVLPPLTWLRVPPRIWLLGIFALIVLAGYGLQTLYDPTQRAALRRLIPRLSIGVISVGVALGVIVLVAAPKQAASAIIGIVLVLITGTALLLWRRVPLSAWAVLIVLDLLLMDSTLIEGRDQAVWLDRYAPLAAALTDTRGQQGDPVQRVYSPDYSLPQQAAAYWNIETFGGIDPFQYADYIKAFESATGVHAKGYSVTLPAFDGDPATTNRNAPIDAAQLAFWHVSHVVSGFPIDNADLRLIGQVDGVYIYHNEQYAAVAKDLSYVWESPTRVDILYSAIRRVDPWAGVLPIPAPLALGWQATQLASGAIRYEYSPSEQFIAIGVSLLTVLVAIGSSIWTRNRASNKRTRSS